MVTYVMFYFAIFFYFFPYQQRSYLLNRMYVLCFFALFISKTLIQIAFKCLK